MQIRSEIKIETLLAFAFGTVFCGILAYASLSAVPITAHSFFFLKVISALSASGVAAVIPGMINVEIGRGSLMAVRAAGAIAVFLLVFKADPPALVFNDQVLRAQMQSNFAAKQLDDAERQADRILAKKPKDAEALNVKGGVAYYRADYGTAEEFFKRAHRNDSDDDVIASNYANALVETGNYDVAIALFRAIDDKRPDRAFTLGRAYFYAGDYSEANAILERVPKRYWNGAGRIIQAATLVALADAEKDMLKKEKLLQKAADLFAQGYRVKKSYWNGIFDDGEVDVHLPHDKAVPLLLSIYRQVASS